MKKRKKTNKKIKNKALSKSYVDAVLLENMWWNTQQAAGKKGLTGKETHSKKSCRKSQGPFHSDHSL